MMATTLRLAIAVALLGLCHGESFAQPARVIGVYYLDASAILDPFGSRSNLYKPLGDTERELYFTPFFVFDGELKNGRAVPRTRVVNGRTVVLTLLVSPVELRRRIADYVRDQERLNPREARFATVTESSLIPAEFRRYEVRQLNGGQFATVTQTIPSLPSQISLGATFGTPEEARDFAAELESGEFVAEFNIETTLNARFTTDFSEVVASGVRAKDTDAVVALSGAGSLLRVDNVDSGAVSVVQLGVTRTQRTEIEGRLREELRAIFRITNDADLRLLDEQLRSYLGRIFPVERSVTLDDSFAAELGVLSTYSFDPRDISADEVAKLALDVKNQFQNETQDRINVSASASASFAGFGGSASGSYSREELRKLMTDRGWTFEMEGRVSVPKALTISLVDRRALEQTYTFRFGIERARQDYLSLASNPSTAGVFLRDDQTPFASVNVPPGTIVAFAGAEPPPGWLLCNGEEQSIERYPGLAKVVGTLYGTADRAGHFKLPDLRGRVPAGAGKGPELATDRPVGQYFGIETQSIGQDELPNHQHRIVGSTGGQNSDGCCHPGRALPASDGHGHTHALDIASQGPIVGAEGKPFPLHQPSLATQYIIKH